MPTEYMSPEERAFAAALALGLGPDDQAALLGYLMRQENDALERAAAEARAQAAIYDVKRSEAFDAKREDRWDRFDAMHGAAEWIAGRIEALKHKDPA